MIKWWQAFNPAIYLVSILPGITVWLLAASPINHSTLWASTFSVVLLQHGINLLNDAKDWQLGADTEKYDSWVRVHHGSISTTFYHGLFSLITGGILGLLILLINQQLWILKFALPLVALGILYNAGRHPLSYTAAGEWATALCYGPGVFGG
jgi:1,4-dihydroxy-2-naphthoate octaprenyltransferase